MMRKILCCANVPPKEKEAKSGVKAKEALEDTKQAPTELVQLPPPAKLSGSNYNFESWLARNSSGSIASSSRSNLRSPELDFIPDPTSVEYASDPEDGSQEVAKTSNWRRISRSISQDGSKTSLSPDDGKRFSIPSVNRPSSARRPDDRKEHEKPPFDQAAYFQAVKSNNKKRIQAEVDSEHSSRSVSTRASYRFRELETVEEDPTDHQDELPGGPRDRIETAMSTGISALKVPRQPTRPPAAKLSIHGLKVDPTDFASGDRRRSSCPKAETESKVAATQLVIRGRGSLPLIPSAPVLAVQQVSSDQDDESFKTWRLSQCIPQADSQAALSNQTQDALDANVQSVVKVDRKHETEPQQECGSTDTDIARNDKKSEAKAASEANGASVRPHTADSAQSPDGSGWETWLLAEKLTAQDDSVVAQQALEKNDKATTAVTDGCPAESSDKDDMGSAPMIPTSFCNPESHDASKAKLLVDRHDYPSIAKNTLSPTLEMDNNVAAAVAGSVPAPELHYPSSSVYSSTQNTRHASPIGSKNASYDEDADSLIDLDLAQLETFNNLKEQRSDESYRTAPDQNHDAVVPSIVLPIDDASCGDVSVTSSKYRHEIEMPANVIGIQSQGSHGDAHGMSCVTQNGIQNDAPTRKSSFLKVLRNGKGSISKGHGKSHSQPSADLCRLGSSSASHENSKPTGHAKSLSNLGTRSHIHPTSRSPSFTAPKLTESATAVWKRAFKVEHDQREAKYNADLKKITIPARITDDNAHHALNNDDFIPNNEMSAHSSDVSLQLDHPVTSQHAHDLHAVHKKTSTVVMAQKADNHKATVGTH
ncbi:uncharacterized protein GLRG_06318 [Colletotrichum graminicola M1.001]|uniref:Uncharacterized protein n=1 Tax=Colletotrichum graminicola (strain M1.001 / M2 / FGSC 10212) TaxID=645133 RepID=E3QJY6_COLGM|nr:uncharacterized protein GLRG_06318 [Colletotrichum graminicola M1.001]EFQ31174.1 hypothetical protein GLRG_06318 [Colletotrichum graminicola M1.001]